MIYNGVQAHEVEYRNLEGQHDGTVYAQKKADPMLETRFEVAKVKGVVEATDLIALDGSTTVTGKSRLNITEYRGSTSNSDGKAWGKGTYPIDIDDDLLGQTVVIYVKGLDYLSPNAAGMMVHWKPYFAHCPQMRIWKT